MADDSGCLAIVARIGLKGLTLVYLYTKQRNIFLFRPVLSHGISSWDRK